jgi:starvation-inducible DNA-binding protein
MKFGGWSDYGSDGIAGPTWPAAAPRGEKMRINIGLNDKQRGGVITILNTLLGDEFVLYTKTRRFHWNVTGPQFGELHQFFEDQYDKLSDIVDEVAERVRALDGLAAGSLEEFLKLTHLPEEPNKKFDTKGMLGALLADHESIAQHLRQDLAACQEKFGDVGTSDFLTGLMQQHEHMAWMLRSYLK